MNTKFNLHTLITYPITKNLINTFRWNSSHLQLWVALFISPISKFLGSAFKSNSFFASKLSTTRNKKQFRLFSKEYSTYTTFNLGSKVRRVSKPLVSILNSPRVTTNKRLNTYNPHPSRLWQPLAMEGIKNFPLKRMWRRNLNKQLLEVDGYQPSELSLKLSKTNVHLTKLSNQQKSQNSSRLSNFLQYVSEIISTDKELSGVAQVVRPVSLSYKIRRKSKRRYKDNSYVFLGIKGNKLNLSHRIYPKFSKKTCNQKALNAKVVSDIFKHGVLTTKQKKVIQRPLKFIRLSQKRVKIPSRKVRQTLQSAALLWNKQFAKIPRRKARKKPKWVWKILRYQWKFFTKNSNKNRQFRKWQRVKLLERTFRVKPHGSKTQRPVYNRLSLVNSLKLSPKFIKFRGIKALKNHSLKPGTLTSFSRTPFFFLELINSSLTNAAQLVQPTRALVKSARYVVFQTANSIKINIFRRLMAQKLSSDLKIKAMRSLIRTKTVKSKKNVLSAVYTKYGIVSQNHNFHSFFKSRPMINAGNPWFSFSFQTSRLVNVSTAPRIKRIRFKPGYSRIWRKGRATVQEILGVSYRYQYRLTPKLQKLFMQTRNSSLSLTPLTLEFSLLSTRLITDCWVVRDLINTGTVFLNGVTCLKSETRLFPGDLVQLMVHLKFYTVFKWLANVSFKKQRRLNKVFYRRIKAPTPNRPYRMEKKLPDWFFNLNSTYGDIPSCFEVDYFTLSTFVVHSSRTHSRKLPWKATNFDYSILNMYNWKYIT